MPRLVETRDRWGRCLEFHRDDCEDPSESCRFGGCLVGEFHQTIYPDDKGHDKFYYWSMSGAGAYIKVPPECMAAWLAGDPWEPVLDYLFETCPDETARLQMLVLAALA